MSPLIVTPTELTISMIYPDLATFQGTRAMLEAEGIVPANIKWPDGYDDLWWDDGKFRYFIRRKRPDGAKGPRKLFVAVDWWSVRQLFIAEDHFTRELKRKEREVAEYVYINSAKGRVETVRRYNSYMAACEDKKFQAFKALIPGLIKPKRGRHPKNINQTEGAAV